MKIENDQLDQLERYMILEHAPVFNQTLDAKRAKRRAGFKEATCIQCKVKFETKYLSAHCWKCKTEIFGVQNQVPLQPIPQKKREPTEIKSKYIEPFDPESTLGLLDQ